MQRVPRPCAMIRQSAAIQRIAWAFSPRDLPAAALLRGRHPHAAFTLLEVVVGLVLMATVLSALLVAYGRQQRQLHHAKQVVAANQYADQLLAIWHESADGIPLQASGADPSFSQWGWQTHVVDMQMVFGEPLAVVRIEIVDLADRLLPNNGRHRADASASKGRDWQVRQLNLRVLSRVDVVRRSQQ